MHERLYVTARVVAGIAAEAEGAGESEVAGEVRGQARWPGVMWVAEVPDARNLVLAQEAKVMHDYAGEIESLGTPEFVVGGGSGARGIRRADGSAAGAVEFIDQPARLN